MAVTAIIKKANLRHFVQYREYSDKFNQLL